MNCSQVHKYASRVVAGVTFFLLLIGCESPEYEKVLEQAGANRPELEQVLRHYESRGDTLKLEASKRLIAAMSGKYSLLVGNPKEYAVVLDSIVAIRNAFLQDPDDKSVFRPIPEILAQHDFNPRYEKDLTFLKSAFLIKEIDDAFRLWELAPWKDRYSFDDFCEYILPYDIGPETPCHWRETARETKTPHEDSLTRSQHIRALALELIHSSGMVEDGGFGLYPYPLNFDDIRKIRICVCDQYVASNLYYYRSRSIPSTIDFVPVWANRAVGHCWNRLILPDGTEKSIGTNSTGHNGLTYKIAKIYRKSSYPKSDFPYHLIRKKETTPSTFRNRYMTDVTDHYQMPMSDVSINLERKEPASLVYLATFNNREWIPVAFAVRKGRGALFHNMGRGVLPKDNDNLIHFENQGDGIAYLPVYSMKSGIVPAAKPFILDSKGALTPIVADTTIRETVVLKRKYPEHPLLVEQKEDLVGSRFFSSSDINFAQKELIFTITRPQDHILEKHPTKPGKKVRYVRFSPPSDVETVVAELQFFDLQGEALCGKAVGNFGFKLLDDNILTFHRNSASSNKPITIDFGRPVQIGSIAYSARTDANEVQPGDLYELLWWDNQWISLGCKNAKGPRIVFDGVPKGALLWLRNRTRGTEERIFCMQNGVQVWW